MTGVAVAGVSASVDVVVVVAVIRHFLTVCMHLFRYFPHMHVYGGRVQYKGDGYRNAQHYGQTGQIL